MSNVRKVTALQAWARAGDSRFSYVTVKRAASRRLEESVRSPKGMWIRYSENKGPVHGRVVEERSDNLLGTWQSA